MKVSELYDQKIKLLPLTGYKVTLKAEEILEEVDCPMQCDIRNLVIDNHFKDDTPKTWYKLILDFKPYEEFNKSVAVPAFFDENRNPTLTWFESKFYNPVLDLYLSDEDELEDYLVKR